MLEREQDYYGSHWVIDPDPTLSKTLEKPPRQSALNVAPIQGVHPFAGARNPLTRSNTARRVSFAVATAATSGMPALYHFESEAESAVAIEALLAPDLYGLEVQLPAISYRCRRSRRDREHHFDIRLTFKDGYRRAIFVRNGDSLGKPRTQDEISDIFDAIPTDFADDAIVVNADDYTRAYRDNLRRLWYLSRSPISEVDEYVEAVAHRTKYWLFKDLIARCDLPRHAAWQSAMRLVARRILQTDWHAVINLQSRVWLD